MTDRDITIEINDTTRLIYFADNNLPSLILDIPSYISVYHYSQNGWHSLGIIDLTGCTIGGFLDGIDRLPKDNQMKNKQIVVSIKDNVRLVYRNNEWGISLKVEIFKRDAWSNELDWLSAGTIEVKPSELSSNELFDALHRLEKLLILSD